MSLLSFKHLLKLHFNIIAWSEPVFTVRLVWAYGKVRGLRRPNSSVNIKQAKFKI